jgi:succinate dehydrogenase/fumarate reductase flavoprotein subunit
MVFKQSDFDVLVIGGGLAAMRAALEASARGMRTAMMLKGVAGESGSSAIAGGGLAAVMSGTDEPDDDAERHYADTLTAGDHLNDPALVRTLVREAGDAIRELEAIGAEFVRNADGGIAVFLAPAHTARRSVRVEGGGTGRLIGPLTAHLRAQPIEVLERTTALDIVVEDGSARGVVAVQGDELLLVRAKAIVLASGGAGRIYPLTSTMAESTGDGYAMALRCGLALTGMEFVQFTPTALAFPDPLAGTSTGGVLLGLPHTRLWNSKHERFMERYDPERKEASTRAILSRAIQTEVVEGRGSPHGGVFLELTANDPETLERLAAPFMKKLAPHGIDIRRHPIEIAPAVHYFMGGIEIDTRTQTALRGLYAAGEVTGGVQGSNRLSSNSLSEVNVFGRIAGREAAQHARTVGAPASATLERTAAARLRCAESGRPLESLLDALHAKLKQVMFAHAGIVRDAASMQAGIHAIAGLRAELAAAGLPRSADVKRYYEVANMLDVGEAVTRSALHREESRGSHFRVDFPERNDARWRVVTRVRGDAGALQVSERPAGAPAAAA